MMPLSDAEIGGCLSGSGRLCHSGTSTYRMKLLCSKVAGFYSHAEPLKSDKFALYPPQRTPPTIDNACRRDSLHDIKPK